MVAPPSTTIVWPVMKNTPSRPRTPPRRRSRPARRCALAAPCATKLRRWPRAPPVARRWRGQSRAMSRSRPRRVRSGQTDWSKGFSRRTRPRHCNGCEPARRAKPLQAHPSRTKKNQGNELGFSWIFLDSFVQFGPFQWVTGDPKKKNLRPRRPRARCIIPPSGAGAARARTFGPSPSMPTSLSLSPPWRFIKTTKCHELRKESRT